jgi:hypothetical protein
VQLNLVMPPRAPVAVQAPRAYRQFTFSFYRPYRRLEQTETARYRCHHPFSKLHSVIEHQRTRCHAHSPAILAVWCYLLNHHPNISLPSSLAFQTRSMHPPSLGMMYMPPLHAAAGAGVAAAHTHTGSGSTRDATAQHSMGVAGAAGGGAAAPGVSWGPLSSSIAQLDTLQLRVLSMAIIFAAGMLGVLPPILGRWLSGSSTTALARLIRAFSGGTILALAMVRGSEGGR